MSIKNNAETAVNYRYSLRAAVLPVFLSLLLSSGLSYAGGKDSDNSTAQASTTAANKPESETQYETSLSDYENGGYFTYDQVNQPATVSQNLKPAADHDKGGYIANK